MKNYRQVLATPGAAAFCAAGALARLPQGMLGLGAVLMLSGLGRTYALAGLVAGAIAISQALVAPHVSRAADRLGQARVLLPQLLVHIAAVAALVLAAEGRASGWLLVALGVVTGGSLPQVGAFARARWTALLADAAQLRTALAIESLIDEAVFIVGPVVVAFLATAVDPAAGLLAAIALVALGCLAFAAQRRTEPPPRPVLRSAEPRTALSYGGLRMLVGVFVAIGAVFGLIEVAVVALTREAGAAGAAGPLLALWATGSLLAGIAYGAITWRAPARRRFLTTVTAFALGTLLIAAAQGSLTTLTAALFVAGLANAPTLITGNTLVPESVPRSVVTEGYTWLGVMLFAGIAVGSALSGVLVDAGGGEAGLFAACAAAACAVLVTVLGSGLRRRGGAADERWAASPD